MTRSTRRQFLLQSATSLPLIAAGCATSHTGEGPLAKRPNVVLILTDDQGYGDLGCHGNHVLKTPNLDRLHAESVRFTHFHVSPVCTPTRASLMTGRYNFRTGAIDTYLGRAMMSNDETTLAEVLSANDYRTGIFGKWHLGDNYPMRAMDQGFEESLVLNGGGIAQPSDPEYFLRKDTYFDPVLRRNGVEIKSHGYCTDIFTDAAIEFIETSREAPFFVYLPYNAPHVPLQIHDRYAAPYMKAGLDEETARTYAMIANIDENVGRLLSRLRELGLEDNTIVLFLTDNGGHASKNAQRYDAGLRAQKGSVYDGGIRVPCFVRWPKRFAAGHDIGTIAAHIDLMPTILDACGVSVPKGLRVDGTSLLPLIEDRAVSWPDRTLYFQWHRGDVPELYNNCAARSDRYKLVNGKELYDMQEDPGEKNDVAAQFPNVVAAMRQSYGEWFRDVCSTRGFDPPRIEIGSVHENPSRLSRQDWRGAKGWGDEHLGYWEVAVGKSGRYEIVLEFAPNVSERAVGFSLNGKTVNGVLPATKDSCTISPFAIGTGNGRLEAWVEQEGKRLGPRFVHVRRL